MADDDLTLRMRTVGARPAAREVGQVARSVDQTGRASRRATGHIRVFSSGVRGMVSIASGAAGALGVLGLAGAFHQFTGEARESNKANATTRAHLKSIGASSWITAKAVGNLSNRIGKAAAVDDEMVQSGANLLLTFKHVRNEAGKNNRIFDRATQAAIDLSASGFGAVGQTAKQLGKALNDPIKGMSALSRSGVTFDASQQKVITHLVETGHQLQAQKIMMREVEKQVKGTAKAQADPLDRLRFLWEDISERIGLKLLPVIDDAVTWFMKFERQVENGTGAGGKFRSVVERIAGQVVDLFNAGKDVVVWIAMMVRQFQAGRPAAIALGIALAAVTGGLIGYRIATIAATAQQWLLNASMIANPIGLIVVGLAALAAAFVVAYVKVKWFRNAVDATFQFVKDHWKLLVLPVAAIAVPIFLLVKHFKSIKATAQDVYRAVVGAFTRMVGFITGLPGKVSSAATGMWDGLKAGLVDALNWVIGKLNWLIDKANALPFVNIGKIGQIAQPGLAGPTPAQVTRATSFGVGTAAAAHPHGATGGTIISGGGVMVGERGPELVTLPRGAQIHRNEDTQRLLGDTVIPITLSLDGRAITQVVHRHSTMKKAVR